MAKSDYHLLVVDDDPNICKTLLNLLGKNELYHVSTAQNGEEGLEKWELANQTNCPFDLIIVDLRMPKMDGETVIRKIHKENPKVALISLTGQGDLTAAYGLLETYQISNFLYKPLPHPKVILFIVEMALEKLRLEQQIAENQEKLERQVEERTAQLEANNRRLLEEIDVRKQVEEKLKLAKEKVETANKAKSLFLNKMHHEFRTPLNAISGFCQLLMHESKSLPLPEQFQKQLQYVHLSSHNLTELVNNLLDFSEIEDEKVEVTKESFDLKDLIQTCYEAHKLQADQKGIEFIHEITSKLPKSLFTDRVKLNQILSNLLDNAIKFTPEGKNVWFRVKEDQKKIIFMVNDEGIGIPDDRKEAVFEFFEQVDESISRRFGGIGLGLTIARNLAERLGGTITMASSVGVGSAFNLILPYKKRFSFKKVPREISLYGTVFSKDHHILVVEDDMINQELMKSLLNEFGVTVHISGDGQQGLDMTKALTEKGHPPDLIMMDLRMPVMGGIEAARQIRLIPECQSIPIVAISGDAFTEQQGRAATVGMVDYITKPFMIEDLKFVLNKYLTAKNH